MGHFKTVKLGTKVAGEYEQRDVKININVDGKFYCTIPDDMEKAIPWGAVNRDKRVSSCIDLNKKKNWILSTEYNPLVNALNIWFSDMFSEDITTTQVIRYVIKTDVSFAENEGGDIFPNAGYEGAEWVPRDGRFGDHHATNPSPYGYSVSVGAEAHTKKITRFGEREEIKYEPYYGKDGSHHGHTTPAERLNSWCSFTLRGDRFSSGANSEIREMTYTDEAAEFFFNMMYGMAKLARTIQHFTFDEEDLLKTIESGLLPMLEKKI